ncbi:hypothetical protein MLD38_026623 [Melastoma candidum]|uniref:Uncharacterized protein n=1 Tax=Melastoma candidum TaxID=119954 RepID=A0ACB9P038_9MYRT|nr:hypothetical protein MLD38_026623 [Melastoma candidum]
MECLADGRSEPCLEVRKRKAGAKKSDENRRPLTKVVTEKEDKRQKRDGESRSWFGTTSPSLPGTSSSLSSSSSSSTPTCNVSEVSSPLYFEGYGHIVGGMAAFFDEEEVFNMHGLLDGMAEGLMASPLGCGLDWGGVEYVDLTLWSNDD